MQPIYKPSANHFSLSRGEFWHLDLLLNKHLNRTQFQDKPSKTEHRTGVQIPSLDKKKRKVTPDSNEWLVIWLQKSLVMS